MDERPDADGAHDVLGLTRATPRRSVLRQAAVGAGLLAALGVLREGAAKPPPRRRRGDSPRAGASTDVITACAQKNSGALRLITSGESCQPSETTVSWNVAGPAGPAGPMGATGPAGPGASLTVTARQGDVVTVAADSFAGGSAECHADELAIAGGVILLAVDRCHVAGSFQADARTWNSQVNCVDQLAKFIPQVICFKIG